MQATVRSDAERMAEVRARKRQAEEEREQLLARLHEQLRRCSALGLFAPYQVLGASAQQTLVRFVEYLEALQ